MGVAATAGPRPEREQRQRGEEQGEAAHRAHRYRPWGEGYPGHLHGPNRAYRTPRGGPAIRSLAVLLLGTGPSRSRPSLIAVLIAPPIAGLAFGAKSIDARLTLLGADFTHDPRFPERSTIYAADGKTVLATLYLDNREIVDSPDIEARWDASRSWRSRTRSSTSTDRWIDLAHPRSGSRTRRRARWCRAVRRSRSNW